MNLISKNVIKYFFLHSFMELGEVKEILRFYSLNDFQLFVQHGIFSDYLYRALEPYLLQRCFDYLSV